MTRITTARPRSKWRFLLLLSVGGLVVGFGLSECLLIACGLSNPQMYFPDENCASRLQPGLRCYCSKEGAAHVAVNSFGFRDREWTVEKPRGTLRVSVIGDSYIEAAQVDREEMFGAVLERELNALRLNGADRVEVLSFGVSGWSTTQELLALRTHVWKFDPDIVLLAFLATNDVRGNSRALEPETWRPFAELRGGELHFDMSFRQHPVFLHGTKTSTHWKNAIINSSRVLQLVQRFRQARHIRSNSRSQEASANVEAGLDSAPFIPPVSDKWVTAWDITDRLIATMHQDVEQRGKRFVVMTVTSGIQVHPDPEYRANAARRFDADNLLYSERRIEQLARTHGFEAVLLAEPLSNWATQHNEYLHGFENTTKGEGHWNSTGHREAARIVARAVQN